MRKKRLTKSALSVFLAAVLTVCLPISFITADDEVVIPEEWEEQEVFISAYDDADWAEAFAEEEEVFFAEESSDEAGEVSDSVFEAEEPGDGELADEQPDAAETSGEEDLVGAAEAPDAEIAAEDSESAEEAWIVGEEEAAVQYVLMNIPYDRFYAAEGIEEVDAVSSATKTKPRTGGLAGGSYHVSAEGTDISGVIYPVKVSAASDLNGLKKVTDSDSVVITVTNRGQEATTTYTGKDALFENESYAYYVLPEAPAYYKEMTKAADGSLSFGPVIGETGTVSGVEASVTYGARHADIEMALSGTEGIAQGDKVSGVILTTDDGAKYALRHVANIWRATEIGWNLSDMDLAGRTITNIRYITNEAVIDYPVNIAITKFGYVLMNIPYDKFYAAEGVEEVDAVSSASLNKPRTGALAGGSYHVNADGSDITGVTYPVVVSDMSVLEGFTQVTDESSVSITVTNKGTTTTTEYKGKDALFESPSYSYYILSEKPAFSKAMSIAEDGSVSFGAVAVRAASVAGSAELKTGSETKRGDYQLNITAEGFEPNVIYGVIVKTAEGASYGLRHVENIWRNLEIGFSTGHLTSDKHGSEWSWKPYQGAEGQTVTSVVYYTDAGVTNITFENGIYLKKWFAFSASAVDYDTVHINNLPTDIADAKATVVLPGAEGDEPIVLAENTPIVDGLVSVAPAELEESDEDAPYEITVSSGNYVTLTEGFSYEKANVGSFEITGIKETPYYYTGRARKPKLVVTYNGKTLKEGRDYSVRLVNNVEIGRETMRISGEGHYTGVIERYFDIAPASPIFTSASAAAGGKIIVKWKKRAGTDVDGYQVRWVCDGVTKSTTLKGSGKAYYVIRKYLTAGKTYQVSVRSYKKIDGITYRSAWSPAKSITVG